MFRNVLVGVDDGEGGRDAIILAQVLCAEDGDLTLAHVFPDHGRARGGWPDPSISGERERARDMLVQARTEAGVEAFIRWCGASSVGRGLHELAEALGADLLVVGSSRSGLSGRTRLPDDTRAALNGAPCAIAIAPAGYSRGAAAPMREVGVGYDGSHESKHALGVASTIAAELGSRLSAFEVVSIPAYIYVGAPARVEAAAIARSVRSARERIRQLGGVEPHSAYGDTVEELALFSASVDLLVIGSRSYGPVGRLVHGSTAQDLARVARCPLLVLTRAAREAESDDLAAAGVAAWPSETG